MKEGIVGCIVGFFVGKFKLPDEGQANGISGLTANCRECRVPATEERPGGFDALSQQWTDLNDV